MRVMVFGRDQFWRRRGKS